jgi:Spy/CpxP family protein refolding chaperone
MKRGLSKTVLPVMLATVFTMPALLYAGGNIPETPITKILNYKTGLQLTDSQIKKLTIIDTNIKNQMIQVRAQADTRKTEIDKFTSNWLNMNGTATRQLIKEYYDFLAELKLLDIKAIMQARGILTREQLKKFTELASIESMIQKMEPEIARLY